MANRVESPLTALLSLGFVLSAISVIFPSLSTLAFAGIVLAYPAYWALHIANALAVRVYRRQALGIGLVSIAWGLIFAYFGILNLLPSSSLFGSLLLAGQPLILDFFELTTFYWVDASILAGRRTDPLLRDTLSWSRIRRLAWVAILLLGAIQTVMYQPGPAGPAVTSNLILTVLAIVILTPLVSGLVLLPVVARRSGDPSLRRHLRSFALFLVSVLAVGLFYNLRLYASYGFALLYALVWDALLVTAAYFLYASARSLAPLNKISTEETPAVLKTI